MKTPAISQRGEVMPPSPIRKLVPYAEAAKKKGIHVYHLNIGQPDIETPPQILDAVRDAHFKILEYSHSAGNESYRKKLVEYYRRYNIAINYTDVVITTGGSEAILFAMMSCLDPGDEIIIPEPFYANYNGFAVEAGVTIIPVASYIDNGFALPPIEDFEKVITPKTKAILICNPNNPTGYLYTQQELDTLRQLIQKHNLYLIADEAYREFCYEGGHFSALQLQGVENNVVMVDTISKRYSACGARIGALVSRNKLLIETVIKFAQARLSPPTMEQMLGEAAVDLPANYFDVIKAEYKSRRDLLVQLLNKVPGVYCPNPGGAFYAMAKLPVDNADDFCKWILEDFSYNNTTVMLAPASGFYSKPELGKNEVRLAYVLNKEAISAAVACLEQALVEYNA
ncbi:pyridoxal phosphate-dependent aminotransferase [Ilyomonas limi]|uniref:Pyridoxal phosphate-dependent aminotransferase n=1 Tax=Ilyomonas limi TaxID=2575867 RepID=A0A4U3L6E5_9BACT|nr:pyridoxal phosphate-dependent aminotransferase [Ilyomonas limi]TKK69286.1 pyridoxal phosphate-dependent aminotransferase [Ilyomonas limi]